MMRLPMYQAAMELAEAVMRRQPILGDEAHDDAAGPGCRLQGLPPKSSPPAML